MELETNEIVLFDGFCNLCSGAVQFILKHERTPRIKFASLQSEIGVRLSNQYQIDPSVTDSIILISGGKVYIKSDAAIRISASLKRPWSFIARTGFIPKAIRNFIYDLIARNRYRFFGKKDECWLPMAEWKNRFIVDN
jgi:predicted DCC family thiol-disulfide oxidoreductase YuxK